MTSPSTFYKDCLSSDLQEKISEQLKKLLPEQLSLSEEVALHKARCADLVKRWSQAREMIKACENLPDGPEKSKAVRNATLVADGISQQMSEALKVQKDLTTSAAIVDAKAKEAIGEQTIMLFINAVLELVHEMFNSGSRKDQELMDIFEDRLRESVVIQKADKNSLAIEGEIFAMLQTVPGPPELIGQ